MSPNAAVPISEYPSCVPSPDHHCHCEPDRAHPRVASLAPSGQFTFWQSPDTQNRFRKAPKISTAPPPVILSAGRSPKSKDLRTDSSANVPEVRRSFDSHSFAQDDSRVVGADSPVVHSVQKIPLRNGTAAVPYHSYSGIRKIPMLSHRDLSDCQKTFWCGSTPNASPGGEAVIGRLQRAVQ